LYHTSLRGIVHVFERYTNGLKNNWRQRLQTN
jgi:hypothetical protein